MKNTFRIFMVLLLSAAMSLSLSACGKSKTEVEEDLDEGEEISEELESMYDDVAEYDDSEAVDNGIVFEEEAEGAELTFDEETTADDFLGSWTATSGHSVYMYGNCDITIKDDGTWTGNIIEEDFEGTWEMDGPALLLSSELFNATLQFTDEGKLILQEDLSGEGEVINTVLVRP